MATTRTLWGRGSMAGITDRDNMAASTEASTEEDTTGRPALPARIQGAPCATLRCTATAPISRPTIRVVAVLFSTPTTAPRLTASSYTPTLATSTTSSQIAAASTSTRTTCKTPTSCLSSYKQLYF